MLSKADINFIKSLSDKKVRYNNNLFIAEGAKIVNELLTSKCKVYKLYATQGFEPINPEFNSLITRISNHDIERISSLKSTRQVVGLFYMPDIPIAVNNLDIICDNIQDPGNLGTIIRIADWYGLKRIICSNNSADCFNTKTVQASMASVARVKVLYCNLDDFFSTYQFPVYAADLTGENLYNFKPQLPAALIIGNEGSGINPALNKFISNFVSIPKKGNAESLNAAIATAIITDRLLN